MHCRRHAAEAVSHPTEEHIALQALMTTTHDTKTEDMDPNA